MKHLVVLGAVLLLGTATVAGAQAPCSVNTVRGTYTLEMTGRTFEGGLPPRPFRAAFRCSKARYSRST